MSSTEAGPNRCNVTGSEMLPVEAGSADEICAAIQAAAESHAAGTSYSVEVRVLSSSSMAATVSLGTGRTLPEHKLAVNDRKLNRSSIQRFAEALGEQIAGANAK